MTQKFDVIVVGTGTMGAAACDHLSQRGVRVLGLDRFAIPHALGAHHGGSRVIRLSYYEHLNYVTLLRRAYALWDQLNQRCGMQVMHLVGGLYLGHPDGEVLSGVRHAAETMEIDHERLTHEEVTKRFPMFQIPPSMTGVYEDQAGYIVPELAVAAHARLAMEAGAVLHGHEPVTSWTAAPGRVSVTTTRDTYEAGHLIFAAGAWSRKIVGDLGVELVVTRQAQGWVWPRRPQLFAYGRFPIWTLDPSEPNGPFAGLYYGFPMIPEQPGLKVALHLPAAPCDPDTVCREATAEDAESFLPALRRYLPDGVGPVLSTRICLYTNTPDGHFIIDRHPEYENVTVACGFTGHGFKFAPVVGQILAGMATGDPPDPSIDFVRLDRFQ